MALALTIFKTLILFLVSLSYSLYNAATRVYASPPSDHLSFSLTYRDAEGSPLRSVEAIPADLPQDMPMRASVAAGRALRARLNMKRKPVKAKQPLLGRLSYAGAIVGDFYLTIPVGTPPQNIIFLVDTGSEFILTRCSPCLNCTKTTAPSFAHQKSSSFRAINCDSPACMKSIFVTVSHDCNLAAGRLTNLCTFRTAYADGTADMGFISVDSFDLGPAFSKSLAFGCATFVQESHEASFSGMMGLNAGPFSFPSQMFFGSPRIRKKFAYCLPDRMRSLDAAGTIKFGNYNQLPRMRYTPFKPPVIPLSSAYYFVELQGIKVGGSLIKVDKGGKGIMGAGGTIFDSGAAVTHLVEPLYDKLVREMRRQTAHLGPFNASDTELDADLCYKVAASAEEPPKVPAISMHFAGGVDLELGPGSVLTADQMHGDHANIYFCFAFRRSPDTTNIIGNYQTQNYWVEYDLDASTLGLAKATCAHVK